MRITNKMMSNNSMVNINENKDYLDKLNNQMATEKKLTRPSDDPIVAIRSLRLRSSLTEVTQYYGASVPDAQAWVDMTQKSIESTMDILSSMKALCDQGANGTNDASAREKIYEDLKASVKQIYQNGNTSYAGRTIFTGFRTDRALTFGGDTTADYKDIVDTFNPEDVKKMSYIEGALSMDDINALITLDNDETTVKENLVNRIHLSYDRLNIPTTKEDREVDIDLTEYVKNEETNPDGSKTIQTVDGHTIDISSDGGSIAIRPDAGASVTVDTGGSSITMGNLKIDITGTSITKVTKTYTMETGNAKVTYREPLEDGWKASVSAEAGNPDPITGRVLKFEISDGTDTFTIEYDDAAGTYTSSDAGVVTPVHQNTDGSFRIEVTGAPYDDPPASSASRIFNVSPNGRLLTSCYKESVINAIASSSSSVVEQDASGNFLTAYNKVALDPNNQNISDPDAQNKVYLLKDTGELVFGSEVARRFSELKSISGTDVITVTYDKNEFEDGDLRPEHYFDCRLEENERDAADPILFDNHRQATYYTVGTNQNIQINTNAEDVFDAQIIREADDILQAITTFNSAQEKVDRLKAMQENSSGYSTADREKIPVLLDAANKELDIAKNKLQNAYERGITSFGTFYGQASQACTTCGTVDNRLTLISNRLQEEKTTVKTLASENEDVDITNVAVEVKEAELVYNAALMSTGKISQHSLMDYI
ncbi:MAG: hypothetical protein K6F35_12940 [Lachnospiraceae bacterium]|nr:hypothetical protein [Lachnospiraceae bacterium]